MDLRNLRNYLSEYDRTMCIQCMHNHSQYLIKILVLELEKICLKYVFLRIGKP